MTATQTREEWLKVRRSGIGASEAAAVIGLHPWLSPLGLYFDKTGEVTSDAEPTEPMEWGLRLEPVVAAAWQEKNGKIVHRFEPYDPRCRWVHPEHEWMVANLDGLVIADDSDLDFTDTDDVKPEAVFECKTASGWVAADWEDDIPPYVVVQVQHQMAVTGLPRAEVACLIGGSRYVQYTIDRDDETIEALIAAEAEFWARIQEGRPPSADSHPNTADVLKARWSESLAAAVELGSEGVDLVKRLHAARAEEDAAKSVRVGCENRLKQLLGENEVGLVFGELACTWKSDRNGTRRFKPKEIA